MASELDLLQLALPKRYKLVRELDLGGMSRVYLAREEMPERDVAIKVFDERLSAQLGRERFLREVEVTSQLGHPHIVPIHSAGDADGALYYVMPFVRGESLRDRLGREGRLPIEDALRITEQVSGALSHAHERGVVHRDIKPYNILFQAGHAVVADFGIARALSVAENRGPLTHAGVSLGTPDYMSPEQISEETEVDERTDVYALACVLYEMLGGQPPFHSRTHQATLARHLADTVPSLRGLRDSVPGEIEVVIRKALAKAPVDRYASVTDFARALRPAGQVKAAPALPPPSSKAPIPPWAVSRRLAGVLLAAAALGVAWNAWSGEDPTPAIAESPDIVSVAMRPLENRTGDPSLELLGVSLADEVNQHLAQVPQIRPAGLYSVRSLLRENAPPDRLMAALGVGFLLGGSMELRGGQLVIRITEDDDTGTQTDNYVLPAIDLNDVDSLIAVIGHRVAEQFLDRRGLAVRFAASDVPYGAGREEYLRGEGALGLRTAEGMRTAVGHFRNSIGAQGTYAPAHAALSTAYALSLSYKYDLGEAPYDAAAMALAAADSAILLDGELPDGYTARGYARILLGIDVDGAERDFQQANDLAPGDPSQLSWSSRLLAARGLTEEAYEVARRARDQDPGQAGRHLAIAELALQVRDYDEAVQAARVARGIQPELTRAAAREALALALSGRATDCLTLELGAYQLARAICLRRAGQEAEAVELIATAEDAMRSDAPVEAGYTNDLVAEGLAAYHADEGDSRKAAQWITEAFQRSPVGVDARILDSELFAPVADDPLFASALRQAREAAADRLLAARGP